MWPHFFLWSEQVLEAATSPETFVRRLSEYVRNGLVSIVSEEDVKSEGQSQQYYTRLLDISPDQMKSFVQYNEDLNWTIIRGGTLIRPISDRLDWRGSEDLPALDAAR
ncbi:hypothetical protein M408DRAFT_11210 [Serendipita vermifera MAFF 305830]|uniref:Uncharacterized protein n=1 Tax=Serendipita vermifera MAFF 305830 TaxID=933852 RepID=A0A0C3AVQ3_SERVB|nr:hypothetical protein M408DRAFT_11210 [Serendipita vermifera MAFF 305830]